MRCPIERGHFSPYSPSTRHFLNVLYIAVPEVTGYAECAEARALATTPEFAANLSGCVPPTESTTPA